MRNVTKILLSGILLSNLFGNGVSVDRKIDLLSQATLKLIENDKKFKQMLDNLNKKINDNKIAIQKNSVQIKKNNILLNKMYFTASSKTIYYAVVDVPKLNLREKPSVHSKILRVLHKNEKFLIQKSVRGKNSGIWYKIKDGYISSTYVNLIIFKQMYKKRGK